MLSVLIINQDQVLSDQDLIIKSFFPTEGPDLKSFDQEVLQSSRSKEELQVPSEELFKASGVFNGAMKKKESLSTSSKKSIMIKKKELNEINTLNNSLLFLNNGLNKHDFFKLKAMFALYNIQLKHVPLRILRSCLKGRSLEKKKRDSLNIYGDMFVLSSNKDFAWKNKDSFNQLLKPDNNYPLHYLYEQLLYILLNKQSASSNKGFSGDVQQQFNPTFNQDLKNQLKKKLKNISHFPSADLLYKSLYSSESLYEIAPLDVIGKDSIPSKTLHKE